MDALILIGFALGLAAEVYVLFAISEDAGRSVLRPLPAKAEARRSRRDRPAR